MDFVTGGELPPLPPRARKPGGVPRAVPASRVFPLPPPPRRRRSESRSDRISSRGGDPLPGCGPASLAPMSAIIRPVIAREGICTYSGISTPPPVLSFCLLSASTLVSRNCRLRIIGFLVEARDRRQFRPSVFCPVGFVRSLSLSLSLSLIFETANKFDILFRMSRRFSDVFWRPGSPQEGSATYSPFP
jgi:hypothetical protein